MPKSNRRNFLAMTAALPAAASPALAARTPVVLIAETRLAGEEYYDINFAWDELDAGMALDLRREPRNRHDPNAVAIVTPGGKKLGYLPRIENGPIAALLDAGRKLNATITRTVDHRHPETAVLGYRDPFYKIELID